MEKHFIIHIPHSSFAVPEEYRSSFLVNDKILRRNQLFMTDAWTEELFRAPDLAETAVVNPVSRLLCDVERFRDDKDEACSRTGHGLMYTFGMPLRRIRRYDGQLRERILADFYDPHHAKLTAAADAALENCGRCTIFDGHSFNSFWPPRLKCLFRRPDFCVGTDPFHTPEELKNRMVAACREAGYRVRVNTPYCGAITPIKYYGKEKRVVSVMVEVNRRLYMNEKTGEKTEGFEKTRAMCRKLLEIAESYE